MKYLSFLLLFISLNVYALPYLISDCEVIYFGIQGSQNNNKALQCFIDQKDYFYVALMYANGEGANIDYNKSTEYFVKAISDHQNSLSLQEEAFKNALDKRIQNSAEQYEKIDFCNDLAGDTYTTNKCAYISGELANLEDKKRYNLIKTGMKIGSQRAFDKLLDLFLVFRKKDSLRMYQLYIGGTIRDIAFSGQETYLNTNFNGLVNDIVKERTVVIADLPALKLSDDILNKIYSEKLKKYRSEYSENQDYKDLLKISKEAQRAWISYRDQWVTLCISLDFKELNKDIIETSIKTTLTKLRNEELQYDPME